MPKRIIAFKSYYLSFMNEQTEEDRKKIRRVLSLMETDDRIPSHYIKFLGDKIYELRVSITNKEARLLFFYDGVEIVVVVNCFIKKTQKTPKTEIDKAKRLRREYYERDRGL